MERSETSENVVVYQRPPRKMVFSLRWISRWMAVSPGSTIAPGGTLVGRWVVKRRR